MVARIWRCSLCGFIGTTEHKENHLKDHEIAIRIKDKTVTDIYTKNKQLTAHLQRIQEAAKYLEDRNYELDEDSPLSKLLDLIKGGKADGLSQD